MPNNQGSNDEQKQGAHPEHKEQKAGTHLAAFFQRALSNPQFRAARRQELGLVVHTEAAQAPEEKKMQFNQGR